MADERLRGQKGMNLDDGEATALAHLITARHLNDADWLEWEDYPELGEFAFQRLVQAVRDQAINHSKVARSWGLVGVDVAYLLEQTQ